MLFKYTAIESGTNQPRSGTIEAISQDIAITSLQRRGLIISNISGTADANSLLSKNVSFFERVSNKEIVMLSRQMATLFDAQVSALRIFRMLTSEIENPLLRRTLENISNDIQGGSAISVAMSKHPKIFSNFYVNMVKSGEESGKLDQTFMYLSDYLERTYEVSSKAKNALIYPAFVIGTFITVMILMLTVVIPKISTILTESGQEIPIYTKVVLGLSNFFIDYGVIFLILIVVAGVFFWKFGSTEAGKMSLSKFKLSIPFVKNLYMKLYLSRISDNMNTMLLSGIPMVRALELTADVVGNATYQKIITQALDGVKSGQSLSDALDHKAEIPGMMVQMMKVGEETGELGTILKTLSKFYSREVVTAVDTLVDLIEPAMIVLLGLGVAFLLASVLIPIYNISSGF